MPIKPLTSRERDPGVWNQEPWSLEITAGENMRFPSSKDQFRKVGKVWAKSEQYHPRDLLFL